ncbi:MAG: cytochrome c family protein [Hyphomicrobiaceae bacterium]
MAHRFAAHKVMTLARQLSGVVAIAVCMLPVSEARAQDAIRGKHVFRKCAVCHVTNPSSTSLLAPPLNDVVGRPAASIPGFEYSEIMKLAGKRGLVWTTEALFHFLDRPEQFIPGTYMTFAGLEPQERRDVIAYLETLTRAAKRRSETDGPPAAPSTEKTTSERPQEKMRSRSVGDSGSGERRSSRSSERAAASD